METNTLSTKNIVIIVVATLLWFAALVFFLPSVVNKRTVYRGDVLSGVEKSENNYDSNSEDSSIGSYTVGVSVTTNDYEQIEISYVYPNSTAMEAGLIEGDIINTIDGRTVSGMQVSDVYNLLDGKYNSVAVLEMSKPLPSGSTPSNSYIVNVKRTD